MIAGTHIVQRSNNTAPLQEVVQMVLEELEEDAIPIPEGPEINVSPDTRVAVTV